MTVRRYENVWKVHIEKTIGRQRISALTPYEVERFFRKLKSDGCGRETVRYVRSVLNRACRLARKWSGNELPNPIQDTELPTWPLSETPEPIRAPTTKEVRLLLQKAQQLDPRYSVCLRVIAATGIRRGEAGALRWSDIDWRGATITVDEAVIPSHGGAVIKSPKTRTSIRRVAIDKTTLAQLRTLRKEQERLAADAGMALPDELRLLRRAGRTRSSVSRHHQSSLHQGPEGSRAPRRPPPAFAPALPGHLPRRRDPRAPEAGPARLVDGPHGPPLHRRHLERGPEGGRAHRVPPRLVGRAVGTGRVERRADGAGSACVPRAAVTRPWASKSPWRGSSSSVAGVAFATPVSRPEPCGRPLAGLDTGFLERTHRRSDLTRR